MTQLPHKSPLDLLAEKLGESWPAIEAARKATTEKLETLRQICSAVGIPQNTVVVFFGSLARQEWTASSDIDWTLLVDGQSDPDHFQVVHQLANELTKSGFPPPGPTGIFGQLSSSHELIHNVGGTGDSNQNLTRRILLLLESVGLPDSLCLERVLRAVLDRYIVSDPSVSALGVPEWRVPRFLLNDIVRFWRTIAVDYATKKWERAGQKWAIKNIKLRMSRKLLFVKGLLLCFYCERKDQTMTLQPPSSDLVLKGIASECFRFARMTPLDVLSTGLLDFAADGTARNVMSAYDRFLQALDSDQERSRLERLEFDAAVQDDLFLELRDVSHRFRDGLESLFFDDNEQLRMLTRRYGVF